MDLKEFLEKESFEINEETTIRVIDINDLGLFFWDRGGKQFVKNNFKFAHNSPDIFMTYCILAQDSPGWGGDDRVDALHFLDCLACLGEERVKELIKRGGLIKNA